MFDFPQQVALIYFAIISVVAVVLTAADKGMAVVRMRRVPEATLFLVAFLGGSVAMYLTMILIRHKTRKFKFMFGLPLIMLLQAAGVFALVYYTPFL